MRLPHDLIDKIRGGLVGLMLADAMVTFLVNRL
jgi:hypothetical protein